MLWLSFGVMLLAAALIIAWPMFREEQKLTLRSAVSIVVVLAISAGLYSQIGSPDAQAVQSEMSSIEEMVDSLAARLQQDPNDVRGWKMLGRSYSVLQRYGDAAAAYERAVALENSSDGQTLVDLGEAVLMGNGGAINPRAEQLFENAVTISPGNPKALFYSGYAAGERGDRTLAADRWETLLSVAPSPDIEGLLRQKIGEWRGISEDAVQVQTQAAPAPSGLTVLVSLDPAAQQAVQADNIVFIIARDPAAPAPPIAAVRRVVGDLPMQVELTDANAMIPGRSLTSFENIEIVARVSLSGQPVARSGDWFGSRQIRTSETTSASIVIDQLVQ